MEYNRMISDKIRDNQMRMIKHYPQPTMFGGIRLTAHPLASGNEFGNPSTLATGGNLTNTLKKMSRDTLKGVAKVGKSTSRAIMKEIPNMGVKVMNDSVVPALSKFGEKALTNYLSPSSSASASVPVADTSAEILGMGRKRRGRPRKTEGGSFKSVMKKVGAVGKMALKKGIPIAEKYATDALVKYAMPAAETVGETVATNPELLLLAAGRKPRKGRFAKGSQEAKNYMKSIRDKRK